MEKSSYKLVGAPCGQHGQYTFYKSLRVTTADLDRVIAVGEFFFVRIWQDSELVSIGELQLLWTDRVSDQTLVSLRLYFLPENTPEGRSGHGEDEVVAISELVVVRAHDLLSWVSHGAQWRWGLRAVWRGACTPHKQPDQEASDSPGVVVFSYPRYCRYRALRARLEGTPGEADWLRDSLVCALGGYAAPTTNTRILYCKDTFEYPELEGHEFVVNHLAPKLKGRPRGRRRRRARSRGSSSGSGSPETAGAGAGQPQPPAPPSKRPTLRVAKPCDVRPTDDVTSDKPFMRTLKQFYKSRGESFKMAHNLKDVSLRQLYQMARRGGGYAALCRRRGWRGLHAGLQPRPDHHTTTKTYYERFLLAYENHERRTLKLQNGAPIHTIDVTESPPRETGTDVAGESERKRLRTPPPCESRTERNSADDTKPTPASDLNQEFLDSMPTAETPKTPDTANKLDSDIKEYLKNSEVLKSFAADNSHLIAELAKQHSRGDTRRPPGTSVLLNALAHKLHLGHPDSTFVSELSRHYPPGGLTNGHAPDSDTQNDQSARRPGRSSLRSVRVKPARESRMQHAAGSATQPDSASSSPPSLPPAPAPAPSPAPAPRGAPATQRDAGRDGSVSSSTSAAPAPPAATNFGINYPPNSQVSSSNKLDPASDDEIVEVPYRPKTPEIIDLDEYPESPQSLKKKKLDILKERGLEVTAIPSAWVPPPPPPQLLLNPVLQHPLLMYTAPSYNAHQQPPKVIQGNSIFGAPAKERTVYNNPRDPFMPPPHTFAGAPVQPARSVPAAPPREILDLTCKVPAPAVEIVRVPAAPAPAAAPENLSHKSYALVGGKAVVGSNLEITLVSPRELHTPTKPRPPQKRSSNGKFISAKTPSPKDSKYFPKDSKYSPKDSKYSPKDSKYSPADSKYSPADSKYSPADSKYSPADSKYSPTPPRERKPSIVVPTYQLHSSRDDPSPTSSSTSRDSQGSLLGTYKGASLAQMMDMPKASSLPGLPGLPYLDPVYMSGMSALYSQLAGQVVDPRQLALYRELMATQLRTYSGLLNTTLSSTPTTKNSNS